MVRPKMLVAACAAVMLVAPSVGWAAAADDAAAMRSKLMEQNGKDAKAGGQILKGEIPFDAAKAQAIFVGMHDVATKFGNYFPKGSITPKSEASPAIWEKPAEFKAALAKFEKDTGNAIAAKVTTKEAFGQQFGLVTANCKSCHEAFRVKK
ncbi:c-type cytochrome [Polymorphobacter fuscus]|uniref:Cytochrome c n=1 Tax=Sandarakinorhabdus fusca TaxID=1439888 RepID=A0A7C9KIZ5_9SPHN|nr:cytochrome c [Polymorphobacter fuscus]KAB7646440.1 cytochrome c [Polymorphobacter fuscus]MQT17681.1 cytochrome c [Polymorphobacter fuscus]NJC09774.1 cytochrome c556 [Polymorphobacter fuscus]